MVRASAVMLTFASLLVAVSALPQTVLQTKPAELFAGLNQFVPAAMDESRLSIADQTSRAALAAASGNADLVSRLDFLEERIFFFDRPHRFSPDAVKPYQNQLAAAPWSCFVRTRTPDFMLDLCERMGQPTGVHELAEIQVSKQVLVFLNARGHMSLAQLDELSKLAALPAEQKSR